MNTEDELFRILARTDAATMQVIYRVWCSDLEDDRTWRDILIGNRWTIEEWNGERNNVNRN